jgi:hypothetical protein
MKNQVPPRFTQTCDFFMFDSMGLANSGNGDYADLWSEATHLWTEVIRLVLETGLRSARLAQTVGSLGDRAGARQLGAYARKSQRQALRYLSAAQLSEQDEQAIRKKLEQIDGTLRVLPPKSHRRCQMKRFG